MPNITYGAAGFPPNLPNLSGTHTLNFGWSELVWAAITVGRAGMRDVAKYGLFSAFEILYRGALIFANLREDQVGGLARSPAYNSLDPSEKGAISYFLGLVMAKLFASRCLDVPWLLHLDVYRERLAIEMRAGNSKPDLVGQCRNGDWVVIEAKGRTNKLDRPALDKAKLQSRMIRKISSKPPKYHVGMQSYFSSDLLRLAVDDPERTDDDLPLDLQLTPEMLRHDYYAPFRQALAERPIDMRVSYVGISYVVRYEPSFDFYYGLTEALAKRPTREVAEDTQEMPATNTFVGPDSVLVSLGESWSSDKMRKLPTDRIR
ncbi:MAG: hypothetical protein JWN34_649 [Bryobacterales bacterium]|nr:hypothetical protein [Bryobacterales bacterium]